MEQKAREFVVANRRAKVISGTVRGSGGSGLDLILEDGSKHFLSARVVRGLPENYPYWKI